jgi:hypothetical protein
LVDFTNSSSYHLPSSSYFKPFSTGKRTLGQSSGLMWALNGEHGCMTGP